MRWLWWWQPPCLLRPIIVNLKDDPTTAIQGVLWSSRGTWFTIRKPELLKAGTTPTPMDGDVVVHRSNVSFFQVIG